MFLCEHPVDGDELYISSIKEMDMARAMEPMLPHTCLIGADTLSLTGDISVSNQQHLAVTSWLNADNRNSVGTRATTN